MIDWLGLFAGSDYGDFMVISVGDTYRLIGYSDNLPTSFRQRLLSLGLLPGVDFTIVRMAPMGDPIHCHFHDTDVMLRRCDMDQLILEAVT